MPLDRIIATRFFFLIKGGTLGPLASFAAAPVQQSGQRKPKHSTSSLTGRSRLADWPKYLSDDLGRMHQESRANPLQPTAWHERLHAAERRKVRSWRGFGDRPGLRKKRRSSDLLGLAPPQEPDPELLGSAQRRQRKRSVQKTDGKCFIGRGGLHRRLRQSCAGRFGIYFQVLGVAGSLCTGLGGPRPRRHEETPLSAATRQVKVVVHFSTQFEKHKS